MSAVGDAPQAARHWVLDMLDRISALRRRFERNGQAAAAAPRPQRILFNSQFAWPFGPVEYSLAAALRLRGHDVVMVGCGGLPRYCELRTRSQERPPCEKCIRHLAQRFDAFGLPHVSMREHLGDADLAYARSRADSSPVLELLRLKERGVEVGRLAFLNLFHYFRMYPMRIEGELEVVFRQCVESAVLIARAAERIIGARRPDLVVSVNGKFLQWAPWVEVARRQGVDVLTWEDYHIRDGGVTFALNEIAHTMRIDDETWRFELSRPFDPAHRREVRDYLSNWSAQRNTPWKYYGPDAIRDAGAVRGALGLRGAAPIVALFPNLVWDSTSVGFESAFAGMYDWLLHVVDYARRRPEVEFVVRAHPGEAVLPAEYRCGSTVGEVIRRERAPLPENVHLLDGGHGVTSYALGEAASVVMVYTSTLGVEFPVRGIRPWVAADAFYAGKGFTLDLRSAEHMTRLLDADCFANRLSAEQVERAERLVHLVRFRRVMSFPWLHDDGRFEPPSFEALAPGGDPRIDDLCERIVTRAPLLDVGARAAAAVC